MNTSNNNPLYKILAFDMDDTLLDSSRSISPENKASLEQLMEMGVKIVLCSGRPTSSLLGTARELLGTKKGEYIIGFNGGAICSVADGKDLVSIPMPISAGLTILKTARNHGILLQGYQGDSFFVEKDDPRTLSYEKSIQMTCQKIPDLETIIRSGTLKLLMNGPRELLLKAQAELQPLAEEGLFTMVFSKPEYLEFVHPEVNKGTGLQKLCDYLGIPISKAAAAGDSFNDREMIEQAGLGIAVANAQEEIKAIADVVLESNHNQSIVLEIKRKFFS